MDDLISHLPEGRSAYVKEANGWRVEIFEYGTVRCLATIATGMDKSAAAWLVHKLREARNERNE